MHFPLLSLILFLPLVGAALILFVPKDNGNAIRWLANIFGFLGFLVSLPLWFHYDSQNPQFQFVERLPWIPSVGAEYFLGVDGFSALMVLLATLFGLIAILSSWTAITERVKEYYIFLLVLQTGMVVSVPLAVGISALEIIVVLVQAYVFTLLTAVFIGMAIHVHH